MTRAIILALCLCACGDDKPKVVVQYVQTLPASPSADLLVQPAPVVTAGAKDVGETIARLSLGNVARDKIIAGWILWFAAAKASVEKANAPK